MSEKIQNETVPLPFNPRSSEFRANPYPTYHYLRTHHPIYYRPEWNDWVLTRYADIVEVLQNYGAGHSEQLLTNLQTSDAPINRLLASRNESQKLLKLWLVLRNPPDHTRMRQVVQNTFTFQNIQALRERLEARVNALIERVKDKGKMEIVDDVAYPASVGAIGEILGIPQLEEDRRFKLWSQELSLLIDMDVTPINQERGLLAFSGLVDYFRSFIAKCRTYCPPQDNLIGTLIQAQAEGKVSEEELIANCILMFFAGHSTTKHLIGNSIVALLQHPDQLRLLQADPSLIEMAINEVLRYNSSFQGVSRTALHDIELSEGAIKKGQIVHCLIGAANRDPAQFPDPDKFEIRRNPNSSLSFGHGIHFCFGLHLARLVAKTAVGTVVRQLPGLSLETESLAWEETFLARGLKSLPVVF
ncbi:cytochrome P450 [Kamptonema formosum]|uniref:cytochrome P450 n=1 Tax=Kamptonema formosum TaxID=331992 RepID=UPI00034911C3|nr:cytochrome P450 [Oscillatoria sp. PCC 10802]